MKLIYDVLWPLTFLMNSYELSSQNQTTYELSSQNQITSPFAQNIGTKKFLLAIQTVFHKEDPEIKMNVTEIIRYNNYPCEDHEVITEDGFTLSLQRIHHGQNNKMNKSRPVVYLQHGLLCSSSIWIINQVNDSLGFILADQGFDVWMGNSRGNTYSRKHSRFLPNQTQFWNWSWDHMASLDLPAIFRYIKKVTLESQLFYVGHSQGTLIALSALSQADKIYQKSGINLTHTIKSFVALSPVAFLGHIKGPLREIALLPVSSEIFEILLGYRGNFLPQNRVIQWLNHKFCERNGLNLMCSNLLFLICGPDVDNLNISRIPVYFSHYPSGTSVQNMLHYIQAVKSQRFQKYDYGAYRNQQIYNQTDPPSYNLSAIKNVPIYLFVGSKDWLATDIDVELLTKLIKVKRYEYEHYNHLDFIWGENAKTLVYDKIVQIFKRDADL